MSVPMQVAGFAVVRPDGKLMLVETFSTDEAKCINRFDFKNYTTMTFDECVQNGYRVAVVTVSAKLKETNMEEKLELFKQAVIKAHAAFAKNKKKLTDLSSRFWVAWMDLEMALEFQVPFEELRDQWKKSYKQFGAPGDFGYGTPCGDGLKAVYDAWRDLNAASPPPVTATTSATVTG